MGDSQDQRADNSRRAAAGQAAGSPVPGSAHFIELLDRAGIAVAVLSPAGDIIYPNDSFAMLTGYSPAALCRMNARELVHPLDQPLFDQRLAGMSGTDPAIDITLRYICQGGGSVRIRQTAMLTHHEGADAIVAVFQDITLRHAVPGWQKGLRSAVEPGPPGTWDMDLAKGLLSYSASVQEFYGLPAGPIPLKEMGGIHPDDAATVAADLEKALRPDSGGVYISEHRSLNEQTGDIRYLRSEGRVVYGSSGEPVMITGTVQDVTEARLVQQALEDQVIAHTQELHEANEQLQDLNSYLQQSNAELEQYAYVASHDLQEPLRKISVFAGMLSRMEGLPKEAQATAEKIGVASARITQLIRDLLDFSRLLKVEHMMRPVDLGAVVQAVLSDFDLRIAEKEATVHVDELPTIEAVNLQMNQLFYNLISNSLKFTREGVKPEISIRCRRLDEGEHAVHGIYDGEVIYYFITVSDNGIGFNSLYAEQIFAVFKRLHTRNVYPGSGIGLALCRRILQNHGGIMTAQSEEGVGTTIAMILPSKQVTDGWPAMAGAPGK
jgi:PAS domain S-box-containing protein